MLSKLTTYFLGGGGNFLWRDLTAYLSTCGRFTSFSEAVGTGLTFRDCQESDWTQTLLQILNFSEFINFLMYTKFFISLQFSSCLRWVPPPLDKENTLISSLPHFLLMSCV